MFIGVSMEIDLSSSQAFFGRRSISCLWFMDVFEFFAALRFIDRASTRFSYYFIFSKYVFSFKNAASLKNYNSVENVQHETKGTEIFHIKKIYVKRHSKYINILLEPQYYFLLADFPR